MAAPVRPVASKPRSRHSGHARLKSALVLRDALAFELGLALPAAMAQLRTTEDNIGCALSLVQRGVSLKGACIPTQE